MRGITSNGRNTVQGTFDDLSEEEKTRAYLQFLQYHQQLEQANETKKFQQMLNKDQSKYGPEFQQPQNTLEDNELDEKWRENFSSNDQDDFRSNRAFRLNRFETLLCTSVLLSLKLFQMILT